MNISIFGAGYVGLVTSVCFAELGHQVVCADVDRAKIDLLQQGISPFYEPELAPLLKKNTIQNRLKFSHDLKYAVNCSDLLFIVVGTPSGIHGEADLQHVLSIAQTIGQEMQSFKLVINKSTAPVGTTEQIRTVIHQQLKQRNVKELTFDVCSNPEFLKEGSAVDDFFKPDRVIIGNDSSVVRVQMAKCYAFKAPYSLPPLIFMSIRAAELTKYAANAMLATKISFINEMANIAEYFGVDIEEVRQGMGSDHRIGYAFMNPGCGYGGSCFPKDVKALIHSTTTQGYHPQLLQAVHDVNQKQKHVLFHKLQRVWGDNLSGKTVALWGLAFKPGTDDMREASSRVLMESVWQAGAKIRAYDPIAMKEALRLYSSRNTLYLASSPKEALEGADALVICTEWPLFREINLDIIRTTLTYPIVIDGRNIYDPKQMAQNGILYFGIGR